MSAPTWIDAAELRRRVSPSRARDVLGETLRSGFDPAGDPARVSTPLGSGEFLLMPSQVGDVAGVKVLGLAPGNTARGLPTIQGWYLLMDGATLTPTTLLDGTALTTLRTPAVSAVGLEALAPEVVEVAVVLGSGPQAVGHAEALLALRDVGRFVVVGRDPGRTDACARRIEALGGATEVAATTDRTRLEEAVRHAQVVLCTTSAAEPVVDGAWVADGACVVAVGSHSPERRELDAGLMGRSLGVVEDRETALREAGDVVLAVADGALDADDLHTLADVAAGRVARPVDRPSVVKTVGMSWEDLVVAAAAQGAAP
ncbi:ornithine cyclodeaminase family protein [Agilicoccus flavus]|uniref:ornithine cyclodeaminase family protein n=1 Tax=Agilicoccus flavus TaxID=2775968 RepID=UPI001CF69CAB|nr:ornithine cyclodeaminase family protein [Agilicoccus flavus]